MTASEYATPVPVIFRHGSQSPCPGKAWRLNIAPKDWPGGCPVAACPDCGVKRYGKPVHGRVSHKHKCGGKCRTSLGPNCECSCGGANHGAGYAID